MRFSEAYDKVFPRGDVKKDDPETTPMVPETEQEVQGGADGTDNHEWEE